MMQFEQLNIDQQYVSFPQYTYCQLDNDGKVYCKVDWMTVIFEKCTIVDVLRWLKLENTISDFAANCYEQSRGYDIIFRYVFNGVSIECSQFGYFGESPDSLFGEILPKIRLELSGSALDYLRSINVDMDTYRFVEPVLPDGAAYHFTRVDWAFDFVNYRGDFVDKLMDHCSTHQLPSGRIPLSSTKGAIGCRIVSGNQKTVYLGSPQSDSMLRIYDKRLQHIDWATGLYTKSNPYNNPDTWFRIEWQTRNKKAHGLAIGKDDNGQHASFKSILYEIFQKYAFADGTFDARCQARPPVEFWLSLFDWKDLESRIIQNAKYVELETYYDKLVRTVKQGTRRDVLLSLIESTKSREKRINDYLIAVFTHHDPISDRAKVRIVNDLNQILFDNPSLTIYDDYESCPGGLYRFHDFFLVRLV